MSISERRENEKEAIKNKIIDAAKEILVEEGFEKLSIRKIANKIEYSPGIIYHYFKDKGEIISVMVGEGYKRILETTSKVPLNRENPEKTLEEGLRLYIDLMLKSPEEFKIILMSNIEEVKDKVNILERGISKERKSLQGLCNLVNLGMETGKFKPMDVELTAQILWTATHGLISRLILEENISKEQKERLINHHFEILIKGIKI
ncbi:TetR/AcrR family transcriptional regulator [Clostridium sp. 'White wine YQ']|uniref:TetR/AcrR family transcriptional regulator n=1 Tax=Clostridium sp. 'White wine YQ' TaxID=3027474 RepID=UPI002365950D|nr:TetR/AcrR family transcriptional regulator [Clostridium sp. 'White wine YQ']MDD7794810.1 TetR/AcrR family transcriptional regulator [Clostridium sp. 'White wine YQ']